MPFFNNIFAATYNFYSGFKRGDPQTSATGILAICQIMLIMMILAILQKIELINLRNIVFLKLYVIAAIILLSVFLFKYYSKEKIKTIIEIFNRKPAAQQKLWGYISLITFVAPIIAIAFLTAK